MIKPVAKNPVNFRDFKNYVPVRHPQQHRIEEFRIIPSLWTKGTR